MSQENQSSKKYTPEAQRARDDAERAWRIEQGFSTVSLVFGLLVTLLAIGRLIYLTIVSK